MRKVICNPVTKSAMHTVVMAHPDAFAFVYADGYTRLRYSDDDRSIELPVGEAKPSVEERVNTMVEHFNMFFPGTPVETHLLLGNLDDPLAWLESIGIKGDFTRIV